MKKQFISLEKIQKEVAKFENDHAYVALAGIVCSVEPKNGKREFDDELGYGKFMLNPNNFVVELDVPAEEEDDDCPFKVVPESEVPADIVKKAKAEFKEKAKKASKK